MFCRCKFFLNRMNSKKFQFYALLSAASLLVCMFYAGSESFPTFLAVFRNVFVGEKLVEEEGNAPQCFPSMFIDCSGFPTSAGGQTRQGRSGTFIYNSVNDHSEAGGNRTGMKRVREKMEKGLPIAITVVNSGEFPESELPCLQKRCVYNPDEITEGTDVVYTRSTLSREQLELVKPSKGQLVYYTELESPLHSSGLYDSRLTTWRYTVNLTSTYLTTSDVFHPYNSMKFVPPSPGAKPDYVAIAKSKTKMSVWMVSNCATSSLRELVVKELQMFTEVDILGNCGNLSASPPRGPADNIGDFLTPYRFYLSFENSMCQDYVTEKFFKLFTKETHVVPVVRGMIDYKKYFPPKTFIDVASFKSVKELADYLNHLSVDAEEYASYLEQMDMYHVVPAENHFCMTCDALRSLTLRPKMYDMNEWLQPQCRT